eukprot:TRINITY_DN82310_c0_g1_i1.p1 TRINITY_DN82310_c0_g1~~TRINITY_DN82310_c0_g1_i1.p1  ORF type:complete len:263 (+),score=27.61 TRINITY_DN82310_c0_g1_i1:75-863(+)
MASVGLPCSSERSAKRLRGLWTDRTFTDLSITCGEETFSVHRSVLAAASPVFHRMLTSGCKEGQLQTVDIKAEPENVRKMLEFIYGVDCESLEPVPKRLRVSTPDQQRNGVFHLQDRTYNGHPTWKRVGKGTGDMWLASLADSKGWQVVSSPGYTGRGLIGPAHHGKMPHMTSEECTLAHDGTAEEGLKLLELATFYNVTDLVLVLVQRLLNNGQVTKENVATVGRAVRDAGSGKEAEAVLASLRKRVSEDQDVFAALVRGL